MNWVESLGGSLILIEKDITKYWGGVSSSNFSDAKTDYDRACETSEYLEIIKIRDRDILVFGDEPLTTSFYNLSNGKGLIIVRHVYANSRNIEQYLQDLDLDIFKEIDLQSFPPIENFNVKSDRLEIRDATLDDCIEDYIYEKEFEIESLYTNLSLEVGSYQILSTFYQPNDHTRLLLHKLQCS